MTNKTLREEFEEEFGLLLDSLDKSCKCTKVLVSYQAKEKISDFWLSKIEGVKEEERERIRKEIEKMLRFGPNNNALSRDDVFTYLESWRYCLDQVKKII